MRKILLIIIVLLLTIPCTIASEEVIINSENWQDVYNGMIFANIKGFNSEFISSYDQGIELLNLIDKNVDKIILIESSDKPIASVIYSELKKKYNVEYITGNINEINLNLIKKSETSDFVVMDDSYGHNAIAIGGYASKVKAMPIFANKRNIKKITSTIENINHPSILIYGKVDREVEANLKKYTAEHINEGDKFSNNLKILEKQLSLGSRNQIILTNGNFIEKELLSGFDPVVLVGNTIVPDDVIEKIKKANVKVGIAIGTGIVGNAQRIKDETNLKIFVKFAQGRNEKQLPLDMFEIPSYSFDLDLIKASYNTATQKLELTFNNPAENYLVIKGNYEIFANESKIKSFNDENALFVSSKSKFTKTYNIDLTNYLNEKLFIKSNILMGEDDKAFENVLKKNIPLNFIEFTDNSNIEIEKIVYNKRTKRFEITLKNLEKKSVYVRAELVDLIIDDDKETLSSKKIKLNGLEEKTIKIKALLEPVDIADNEYFDLRVFYGERENVLAKVLEDEFELKTKFNLFGITMFISISLLIIISLILMNKRKKERKSNKKILKHLNKKK